MKLALSILEYGVDFEIPRIHKTYKLKDDSFLRPYLANKGIYPLQTVTLNQVLNVVRYEISTSNLLDVNNPAMVHCSPQLRILFGRSVVHLSSVKDLLLQHLTEIRNSQSSIVDTLLFTDVKLFIFSPL